MKTTSNITEAAFVLESILIEAMDIPRATFHRRAIDYFLEKVRVVHPYLLIKDRKDPNYVVKKKNEQFYLDDERREKLLACAEENGCGISVVLFQALMSYCEVLAPLILGEEMVKQLFD